MTRPKLSPFAANGRVWPDQKGIAFLAFPPLWTVRSDTAARTSFLCSQSHAGRTFLEPRNEAELFGLFSGVCALSPTLFDFEPLDYNTSRGIDMIVRNRTGNKIIESEFSYLELKYLLKTELNHGFKYLRWIVCWDFSKGIKDGSDFEGIEKGDFRVLESGVKDGVTHYFLTSKTSAIRTQVIKLREYLEQKIALKFESPTA